MRDPRCNPRQGIPWVAVRATQREGYHRELSSYRQAAPAATRGVPCRAQSHAPHPRGGHDIPLFNLIIGDVLPIDAESREFAEEYIKQGAIPLGYLEDALHIAIATLNEMDYLLSWNFRHIVRVKTRRIVNMVNLMRGYPDIQIVSPAEVL